MTREFMILKLAAYGETLFDRIFIYPDNIFIYPDNPVHPV